MNRTTKLGIAVGVVVLLTVFFVPDPVLRLLPTGFCGVYHSLQCQYSTYFSVSAWYSGFGTYYIGEHYFLELGSRITIQIF
ncbi:MAG: hypothetical protein JRN52_03930 [Nitrososphaerota archaeon]|nr:hypothetical protein [Nitrososphaerota archaeon]